MKKLFTYCVAILSTSSSFAQNVWFDGNQIKAPIQYMNGLFVDTNTFDASYEFPAGSGKSTVWITNLWVFGKDSVTNVLKGFGDRYYSSGQDTWPGPLTTDGTAYVSPGISSGFNKIWKITQVEIDSFIANYNNGNVTSLVWPVPNDMITWPVNAALGYEQPHSSFFDNNGDGVYNVYDGDYPTMKGDQMLRWIFNDHFDIHTGSNSPAMGVEVQTNFYGCSSPNPSDPLNRTTFLEYKIINRSDSAYKDVYIGLNIDADIGGALDDYVRSNVTANTIQFYNADQYDDPYAGSTAYYGNPPVQGISVIEIEGVSSQPLMSYMMYYNNSAGVTGDPQDYNDQYRYLQGIWKDNSHLIYGGNGYPWGPFASAPAANYMFPADSDPTYIGTGGIPTTFNWSEENTDGSNTTDPAGDRRGIMSSGPFNLSAGESIRITYAFVTTQDSTISKDSLLNRNIDEIGQITQGYLTSTLPCQVGPSIGIKHEDLANLISLFPNPSSQLVNIQSPVEVERIEIMNMYGSMITTIMNQLQLNVSEMTDGLYFIRMYLKGKKDPVVKKLLIVK